MVFVLMMVFVNPRVPLDPSAARATRNAPTAVVLKMVFAHPSLPLDPSAARAAKNAEATFFAWRVFAHRLPLEPRPAEVRTPA